MRGPMSGQISSQTLSERAPSTQSRFIPTVGRYASLQKKVSSGPQSIHIAYRESSMTRTMVLRDCGQRSAAPRGVFDQSRARMRSPISPPPTKKSRRALGKGGGLSIKVTSVAVPGFLFVIVLQLSSATRALDVRNRRHGTKKRQGRCDCSSSAACRSRAPADMGNLFERLTESVTPQSRCCLKRPPRTRLHVHRPIDYDRV